MTKSRQNLIDLISINFLTQGWKLTPLKINQISLIVRWYWLNQNITIFDVNDIVFAGRINKIDKNKM